MSISSNAADSELPESGPLRETLRQVNAGRKLVIYERTTGLFAHWYIALRCEEECYRAQRYGRPLSIALFEPAADSDAWTVAEDVAPILQDRLRMADLPGYLGNARYILVMPETDLAGAQMAVKRFRKDDPDLQGGVAAFPQDGLTFDQLYDVAARRLASGDGESSFAGPPTPFRKVDRPDSS